jgi:hypothetical protein
MCIFKYRTSNAYLDVSLIFAGKSRKNKRKEKRPPANTFRQQNANENVLSENENVFGSMGVGC